MEYGKGFDIVGPSPICIIAGLNIASDVCVLSTLCSDVLLSARRTPDAIESSRLGIRFSVEGTSSACEASVPKQESTGSAAHVWLAG